MKIIKKSIQGCFMGFVMLSAGWSVIFAFTLVIQLIFCAPFESLNVFLNGLKAILAFIVLVSPVSFFYAFEAEGMTEEEKEKRIKTWGHHAY